MQVMKIRAICISLWERLVTQSISAGNTTSLLFRGWLLLSLPFCVILQQPFTAYRAAVLPYLQYGRLSCCKAGRKGFEPLSPRFGVWYSTVWTTDPCAVYMGCMPTFKSRIPANTHIIFFIFAGCTRNIPCYPGATRTHKPNRTRTCNARVKVSCVAVTPWAWIPDRYNPVLIPV